MVSYYKRTNKKGTSYQAVIRIKGYPKKYDTFKLKSDAQKWAEPIELAMKNGTYKEVPVFEENPERASIKTVHDLIKYFREKIAPSRYADVSKYDAMYDWWDERLGSVDVVDVSASMISACKEVLMTEPIFKGKDKDGNEIYSIRKNNTINKYMMCFSAVLTWAVDELEIIEYNPKRKVRNMPKPKPRDRFMAIEEIAIYLNACREHSFMVYLFVLIALSTAARYSEVLRLTVENVNFETPEIYYLDTKNGEHRGEPIERELADLIRKYLDENNITTGNIFRPKRSDGEYPYIKGVLEKIIKKLDLPNLHIHDMRHTLASHMAMSGCGMQDIADTLGHKSLSVTRQYIHLTKKYQAEMLHKVVRKIIPEF